MVHLRNSRLLFDVAGGYKTGLGRHDGGRTTIVEDFVREKAQRNQISSILTQIRDLSWHQDLLVIQRIQLIMRHM